MLLDYKRKTMNRNLFVAVKSHLGSSSEPAEPPEPLTIGDINSTIYDAKQPIYFYYDYQVTFLLFTPSELGSAAKTISEVAFQMVNTYSSTYTANNQTMKLAHCTDTEFGTNVKSDLTGISGISDLTTVKSNYVWTVNTVEEFKPIPLTTNFQYNGVDSLLVIIEDRDGTYISGTSSNPKAVVTSNNNTFNVWYKYQDGSFPSSSFGTRDSSGRVNTRFTFV